MRLAPVMIGVIALSCVVLAETSPVFAQSVFTFVVSRKTSCIEDPAGFTAKLQPMPPGLGQAIRTTDAANTDTVSFNLNGTYTTQGKSTTGRSDLTTSGATSSCSGTWTFNASDSTIHTSETCSFTETFPGSDSGTITGIQGVLQLTPGGVLVHAGPYPPVVQTVTSGSGTTFRVCQTSGDLILLSSH